VDFATIRAVVVPLDPLRPRSELIFLIRLSSRILIHSRIALLLVEAGSRLPVRRCGGGGSGSPTRARVARCSTSPGSTSTGQRHDVLRMPAACSTPRRGPHDANAPRPRRSLASGQATTLIKYYSAVHGPGLQGVRGSDAEILPSGIAVASKRDRRRRWHVERPHLHRRPQAYDRRSQVFVHVVGIRLRLAGRRAWSWPIQAWRPPRGRGDTGHDVFIPDVDPAGGAATLSSPAARSGSSIPLVAGKMTTLTVVKQARSAGAPGGACVLCGRNLRAISGTVPACDLRSSPRGDHRRRARVLARRGCTVADPPRRPRRADRRAAMGLDHDAPGVRRKLTPATCRRRTPRRRSTTARRSCAAARRAAARARRLVVDLLTPRSASRISDTTARPDRLDDEHVAAGAGADHPGSLTLAVSRSTNEAVGHARQRAGRAAHNRSRVSTRRVAYGAGRSRASACAHRGCVGGPVPHRGAPGQHRRGRAGGSGDGAPAASEDASNGAVMRREPRSDRSHAGTVPRIARRFRATRAPARALQAPLPTGPA